MEYPKRLIEVDLPIKRISVHSRREKSIRHGHISTLHIWWARRPLAACRAVLCASLWPDPADPLCPEDFIKEASEQMLKWSDTEHLSLLSKESIEHFIKVNHDRSLLADNIFLRQLLLDFIADFSNWDNISQVEYLATGRKLTQTAHESLGGEPGTRPLVVDPFAGGGSIPLEALRVGADIFASDLNPIPVLLNKVLLEYIPKYGQKLADEVRKWGHWIKNEAEKELAQFYPSLPDPKPEYYIPQIKDNVKKEGNNWSFQRITKETPIAFLWARTIICEGPTCGAEVPLFRSTYLAKKKNSSLGLKILQNNKTIDFLIVDGIKLSESNGTVKRGSVTCPLCGFVTPVSSVRKQLKTFHGGANHARMLAVVVSLDTERRCGKQVEIFHEKGRFYRLPMESDTQACEKTREVLDEKIQMHDNKMSLVPNEPTPSSNGHRSVGSISLYGMETWGDLFLSRQLLSIITLQQKLSLMPVEKPIDIAIKTVVALIIDRQIDASSSLCRWHTTRELHTGTFGRQVLGIVWDFSEVAPFSDSTGGFDGAIDWVYKVCSLSLTNSNSGIVERCSALHHPLPDNSCQLFFTDPPYYDSVSYADLSDYFYVWLKRSISNEHVNLFSQYITDKEEQAIVWHPNSASEKDEYISKMGKALTEGRRILSDNGLGVIVFAHKSTSGWEAQLQSMTDANWIITASWPVDTEMGARVNARGTASLSSSIHLVCRPRENKDGSIIENNIGDWREILKELPTRIHDWMPRLAAEGVVGADAIFSCLGPALEIFSRYSAVEKPNGDKVVLKEYLEYVWAAVSQEAISMVFSDADARSLEEDARITAMWLWTLSTNISENNDLSVDEDTDDDDDATPKNVKGGFYLEYDTVRKISQGLGASLDNLRSIVEVKGDKARLLPVEERTKYLFGIEGYKQPVPKKKKEVQLNIFSALGDEEYTYLQPELKVENTGKTTLDRLHQAMLLFSAGRSEALKRFLTEDEVGKDDNFWKLAQALNALYPQGTNERRWVEGLQTFKKGLGY